MNLAPVRKAVVAWIGAALILVTSALTVFAEFIPPDVASWLMTGVSILTAVSVYLVRNAAVIDSLPRPSDPPSLS